MHKLAPSILAADFSKLGDEIREIDNAGAHYVHIDVMDGCFVPNISLGIPVIKSIRKVTGMVFDVHLMINRPERYIDSFISAGADIICVHTEACEDLVNTIRYIKSKNIKAAAAIKPGTPVSELYAVINEIDMALIMSVEPGFGGQELIPDTLKKAEELAGYISRNNLKTDIEMDGGIYLSNLKDVLSSGVNIVVAGSAIFGTDIKFAVEEFYKAFSLSLL